MLVSDTSLLTLSSPVVRANEVRVIITVHPSLVDVLPAVCLTTEEFIVAVVIRSERLCRITIATLIVGSETSVVNPLLCIHHLCNVVESRESHCSCVVESNLSFLTLLCCNENNTVSTTCTVDSSCRSILQNLDALNILRVEVLDTAVLDNHSVDYIKRRTGSTNRALTTDSDATHSTRTLRVGDVHTSRLSLHTFKGILYRHCGEVF